jgi:hypothetical protein
MIAGKSAATFAAALAVESPQNRNVACIPAPLAM